VFSSIFLYEAFVSQEKIHEHPQTDPDGGGVVQFAAHMCVAGDQRCGRGGPTIRHAGYRRAIPEGDGKDGKADLRFVRKLLAADSERAHPSRFFFPRTSIIRRNWKLRD